MIIPAVLEIESKKFIQRIERLAEFSKMIHVDIMDGKFVRADNLKVLKSLAKNKSAVGLELHLMVKDPTKLFTSVRKIRTVKRVVLQTESDWGTALAKYKRYYQVGLSFKLETPILEISTYQNINTSFIHLFAITPGAQGNPFRPEVYKKVKEVRKLFPKVPIEIDGAMNPTRIRKLKRLGVNDFVVGSYLNDNNFIVRFKLLNSL